MKFVARWQYHLLWSSIFFTSLSGTILLIMKYGLSPRDEFSVINHPWQGYVLKLHILVSPFMVFSLGYTLLIHALPYLKEKISKALKTGLSTLFMAAPMIISGYLIQVITHEGWLDFISMLHIITSLVFFIVFFIHELVSHKERLLVHLTVIFFFLILSTSPLWTVESLAPEQSKGKGGEVQRAWGLMGTILSVELEAVDQESAERKAQIIWQAMNRIDKKMSTYRQNSELSRINHLAHSQRVSISEDMFSVLSLSLLIHRQSLSAFDITVSPLSRLWKRGENIGGNRSGDSKKTPAKADIQEALSRVGSEKIQLDKTRRLIRFPTPGMSLDLGAIGKGFALDKAARAIQDEKLLCAVLNFGGQIVYIKNKESCGSRTFAVKHPSQEKKIDQVELGSSASLATSGNYEQKLISSKEGYGHIIDPRTGRPLQANHEILSVTVLHPSAALADGWATALFILGPSQQKRILALYPKMGILWVLKKKDSNEPRILTSGRWNSN